MRDMADPSLRFDYSTRNYVDNLKYKAVYDHFFGNLDNRWNSSVNGGLLIVPGSITTNVGALLDSFGVALFDTGNQNNGYANLHTGANMTLIGGNSVHSFGGRFKIPVLSVAAQTFTARYGLTNDPTSSAEPNSGVFLRYNYNVNGGLFQLVCRRAGTEAVFNTTMAFTINDWVNFRIEINAALTQVDLYLSVNNAQPVLVGSVTTTTAIPLNTTTMGFYASIVKTAGFTARQLYVDHLFYDIRFMI